jgi:hypothetical protein
MRTDVDALHPCQTHGCGHSATHTVIAAKSCYVRAVTDRCEPCAAAVAWRYLGAGFGVIIRPAVAAGIAKNDTKQTAQRAAGGF